ncbi:flavin reductase family protein [Kyrpidia tusciae]|uniref:Flavin reductase domain protein FMN-binding protein n=1 Tax=Kyrpidia tusciae (strain DSM 2912 / NBRC 15312 / T2) TaxID=562970 RepID=D5WRC3_KYRT2|nr:flavin reductase family protein [Kyrpidia tusciae]ADG06853.1 flavin reductase domain protein FMN-binding protein [Kyrpidia tusciae DSM 2912]MBE3552234.1 flavin reductase [Kyrpidia tusciae]
MDEQAKKTALRGITYGLYVIGTKVGDDVNAFTANWVTQTSFSPPLVVVAAKKGTTSCDGIKSSGVFSVNVLETGQKDLAFAFFKPVSRVGNKFGDIEFYTEQTGSPILRDALSWFECKVVDVNERGDHTIFVGEVVNAGVHRQGDPMTLRETGLNYGG